jgi:hypothetical protein
MFAIKLVEDVFGEGNLTEAMFECDAYSVSRLGGQPILELKLKSPDGTWAHE